MTRLIIISIIALVLCGWMMYECYDERDGNMQTPGFYFAQGGISAVVLVWLFILFKKVM